MRCETKDAAKHRSRDTKIAENDDDDGIDSAGGKDFEAGSAANSFRIPVEHSAGAPNGYKI